MSINFENEVTEQELLNIVGTIRDKQHADPDNVQLKDLEKVVKASPAGLEMWEYLDWLEQYKNDG